MERWGGREQRGSRGHSVCGGRQQNRGSRDGCSSDGSTLRACGGEVRGRQVRVRSSQRPVDASPWA